MNRLKSLRKSKNRGMTQQELAEAVSIPKRTIQRLENNESQIKPDKAQILADYFGVEVSYLLGYDAYNTFSELITKVNEWAISHGLDKGNPKIEWMKVTEEVGEIRDVFLKPHDFANPE